MNLQGPLVPLENVGMIVARAPRLSPAPEPLPAHHAVNDLPQHLCGMCPQISMLEAPNVPGSKTIPSTAYHVVNHVCLDIQQHHPHPQYILRAGPLVPVGKHRPLPTEESEPPRQGPPTAWLTCIHRRQLGGLATLPIGLLAAYVIAMRDRLCLLKCTLLFQTRVPGQVFGLCADVLRCCKTCSLFTTGRGLCKRLMKHNDSNA